MYLACVAVIAPEISQGEKSEDVLNLSWGEGLRIPSSATRPSLFLDAQPVVWSIYTKYIHIHIYIL